MSTYPANQYIGWGPVEAQADWDAKGGGDSGGDNVETYIQNAINPIISMLQASKDYELSNPFFFDEVLAKEASTAEYSPYYAELLSDYVADVEKTKSRSEADLQTTLEQLSAGREYYLGTERRMLDKALRSTNEGYAGRGLFFSGAREKDRREYTEDYEKDIGEYDRKYEAGVTKAKLGEARSLTDIMSLQGRYTRDLGREKDEAIEGGVLQRKRETREEYEISRDKYYEGSLYPSIV